MKLAFFTLTGWSIGKIEREASAYFPKDWEIKWYDFRQRWDPEEFEQDLIDGYDFVSSGYAATVLMNDYHVPVTRIFYLVYDENEFERTLVTMNEYGQDYKQMFARFKGYAVFSEMLRNVSISRGIKKIPDVLGLGIHVNDYTYKDRSELHTLGYAQKFERADVPQGFDIKRGYLAKRVAYQSHKKFLDTNLAIPGESGGAEMNDWYQGVDCMLVPSLIEGGPLAPFEAAACGIPTIGTPVGQLIWFGAMGAALLVEMDAKKFVEEATVAVNYLSVNHTAYQELCSAAHENVQWFDWTYAHHNWIDFFND